MPHKLRLRLSCIVHVQQRLVVGVAVCALLGNIMLLQRKASKIAGPDVART